MPLQSLRDAAAQARVLIDRHPVAATMPLSAWLARTYVARVDCVARSVEILASNRMEFEARGLVRPLFESFLKGAYILQRFRENGTPIDRTREHRELAAGDVWNVERQELAAMIGRVGDQIPGHFDAGFLQGLEAARAQASEEGAGGLNNLRDFAEAAGLEQAYLGFYGTLSFPCHGGANASIQSTLVVTDGQISATYLLGAQFALSLIDVAAQLLNDAPAAELARAAITKLPLP